MEVNNNLSGIKDIELITLASVRYAMGRHTYIVPVVQQFVLQHWDDPAIVPHRYLFIRDIKNFIEQWYNLSDSYMERETMESWKKLLTKLENNNEDN